MANETEVKALEDKFYSQEFFLSYSGLNKLMYSPRLFYNHYILQEREEKVESYLIEGKVIHCLLLENDSFNDQFIVTPSKLPSDNTRIAVDKVFQLYQNFVPVTNEDGSVGLLSPYLDDLTTEVLSVLVEMNLHQSLKTDQQRLDKIITEETKSYFEFLMEKGNKTLVDPETYERCKASVEILRNNKAVSELMSLVKSDFELHEVYNEHYIETKKELLPFGLKGIMDNIVVDYQNKIIYINDLKTSSKSISDFRESIEYYNYGLQAAIYKRLAINKFAMEDFYKVVFNFVVIDKYQQVGIFEVSNDTMIQWQEKLDDALKQAEWHYDNRNYSIPYEFKDGKVVL